MTTSARADSERQIQAVLDARAAALRAKDARQYVSSFDPTIVKFDLAPPLAERGPGLLDPTGLQWWLDTWDGYLDYELAELTAATGADVAFCPSLNHIKCTSEDFIQRPAPAGLRCRRRSRKA